MRCVTPQSGSLPNRGVKPEVTYSRNDGKQTGQKALVRSHFEIANGHYPFKEFFIFKDKTKGLQSFHRLVFIDFLTKVKVDGENVKKHRLKENICILGQFDQL